MGEMRADNMKEQQRRDQETQHKLDALPPRQTEVAADVRQRLDLYKAGKPYRVP